MNEKSLKKKQGQDLATKRILAVFLVAALVLWGMSFLYDMMTYGSTFMQGQMVNNALLAVSALAAVVLIVIYITAKKRGTIREDRVLNSGFWALCALAVCASSFILAMDYNNGMHILYIFLPVAAVLYLVYYVYERQFFSFCVSAAMSIAAAYFCYTGAWELIPALVLAVALCMITMVLALMKEGKVQELVLGKQFDKRYVLAVHGAMVLLLAVAALAGGKLALIIALGMGVYLLAAAVYYTIKAM